MRKGEKMYIAHIRNNVLLDITKGNYLDDDILNLEVDDNIYQAYLSDKLKVTYKDNEVILNSDYEENKQAQKRNELNQLSLTRADVERAIYKVKGLDFDDILEMVKDNPDVDTKALKIELKANNFYRGNPWIDKIGLILGFNQLQLDNFFETGSYEALE